MKTIQVHKTQAVVQADRSVRIAQLPFEAGEHVRVIVMDEAVSPHKRHTMAEIAESQSIRQSLRGSVLRYDRPTESVGLEDWNLLH